MICKTCGHAEEEHKGPPLWWLETSCTIRFCPCLGFYNPDYKTESEKKMQYSGRATKADLIEYKGKTLQECLRKFAGDLDKATTPRTPTGMTIFGITVVYRDNDDPIVEDGERVELRVTSQY